MAVQAQFGGLAGCLPPLGGACGMADEQLQALLLSAAAAAGNNKAFYYQQHHNSCAPGVASAAQSELTCNGAVAAASRKRGRDGGALDDLEVYVSSSHPHPSSSSLLLPLPAAAGPHLQARAASPAASTSGRAPAPAPALPPEAELDAAVRAECERLRAGLAQACKRQRQAVARAAAASAARALREADAALERARRRSAELEERVRQAAAESQAWCELARSNEAAAAGLRATLDALLLRAAAGAPAPADVEEGFGESGGHDDAASCCFVEKAEDDARGAPASRWWACRACGAGEATVLVLPCRHLCLCKACEPRADACPVCLAAKNASIHVASAAY